VYFSRDALALILPTGDEVPVKVTGLLGSTRGFVGFDAIRVRTGKILNPSANQVVVPDEIVSVAYDVTSESAQWVALMFSPDGGASWTTQMTQIPNTGTISWHAPNQTTDNTLLAVVEVEEGTVGTEDVQGVLAVSDRFSIQAALGVVGGEPVMRLLPPSPNPSGGPVNLGFSLARGGEVEVTVFDLQGRQVATPARRVFEAGPHEVVWDGRWANGRKAQAGLYFLRLRADGLELRERLVRLD